MGRILLAMILVVILLLAGCTGEAPRTGSLEITSTPAGLEVQVILDGNDQGVAPLVLAGIPAGNHSLRFVSPGYSDRGELITVNAGERTRISVDYPAIPTPAPVTPLPLPTPEPTTAPTEKPTDMPDTPVPPGSLYVDSFPQGANILLDGRAYGVTPRLIEGLTPKTYELKLVLVGWKDFKTSISVSPGLIEREMATLELR